MADSWKDEEQYWRDSYASRPYARGKKFETFSPGYRYGTESASRYPGKSWTDVETDLRRDWDTYQYRGQSTWEDIKDAARDAWDRVTGRHSRSM